MVKLEVCIGSSCHKKGSYELIDALNTLLVERGLAREFICVPALCRGRCQPGVTVTVGGMVHSVEPSQAAAFLDGLQRENAPVKELAAASPAYACNAR